MYNLPLPSFTISYNASTLFYKAYIVSQTLHKIQIYFTTVQVYCNTISGTSSAAPADVHVMQDIPYNQAVGSVFYLAVATRPDSACTVGNLAHFLKNPGMTKWKAVKHLFQYIKGTLHTYSPSPKNELFTSYTDADHAGHIDLRFYCLQDEVAKGRIEIVHLRTSDMPADILTKSLSKPKVLDMVRMLRLQT